MYELEKPSNKHHAFPLDPVSKEKLGDKNHAFPFCRVIQEVLNNKNHELPIQSVNQGKLNNISHEKLGHLVRNAEQVTKVLVPGFANFPGPLS